MLPNGKQILPNGKQMLQNGKQMLPKGKQMLPKPMNYETRQYLINQRYKWDAESDINDPDDGSWKGR